MELRYACAVIRSQWNRVRVYGKLWVEATEEFIRRENNQCGVSSYTGLNNVSPKFMSTRKQRMCPYMEIWPEQISLVKMRS